MPDPFRPTSLTDPETEGTAARVVDACFRLHKALGPSLRERHYAKFLAHSLRRIGHVVQAETRFPLEYEGLRIEGALRTDLIVDRRVLVEVKANTEPFRYAEAQVLSYLRHTGLPLAFLVNFRSPLFRQGIRRYVNAPDAKPSEHFVFVPS
ncbi:MAG: hypothetical protein QOE90_1879 [Thermoplasmata archaeon]|jgi:GxxExxY protein|nr:hypothetical protein [Thermoplasmata archaeon]